MSRGNLKITQDSSEFAKEENIEAKKPDWTSQMNNLQIEN
jgi:hypothetical protein